MKTLKQILQAGLTPSTEDGKRFVRKHVVQVQDDIAGNGDDVYNASNIKKASADEPNHGHEPGVDELYYEGVERDEVRSADYKYKLEPSGQLRKVPAKTAVFGKDEKSELARRSKLMHQQDEEVDLEEKTLTPAEKKKREEVAQAIERDNPDMPMAKKMAIATSTAKKVAEEVDLNTQQFIDSIMAELDEEGQQILQSILDEEGIESAVSLIQEALEEDDGDRENG
jgi:uncharacterized protein YeaO (DUF488 family)